MTAEKTCRKSDSTSRNNRCLFLGEKKQSYYVQQYGQSMINNEISMQMHKCCDIHLIPSVLKMRNKLNKCYI